MTSAATHRDSSLELYRIIVMLAIVAHHYVVNSGLMSLVSGGDMTCSKFFLLCFGAWGKVGINCFVLITGYFMCTSSITLRKFLKLYLEVVFYSVVLNLIFAISGSAPLTWRMVLFSLFPITGITSSHFWGAFLVFYLTIPFLNILIANITQRQHAFLLLLLIPVFTVFPFFPGISFEYNHVEWFVILYFISSYLRKYPTRFTECRYLWTCLAIAAFVGGIASVYWCVCVRNTWAYVFLIDSHKISALAISLCFFMAFKPSQNVCGNIPLTSKRSFYSPVVNKIASTTFGVLLIHANSNAMRSWLWCDVCDCAGFYQAHGDSTLLIVVHAVGCCCAVFSVCCIIDLLRQRIVEKPIMACLSRSYGL